jgi:hypothetical protein
MTETLFLEGFLFGTGKQRSERRREELWNPGTLEPKTLNPEL